MSEPASAKWQVLSSEVVYSARPFLEIERQEVRLPDGRVIRDFHQAWITDYVIICAETPAGEVVMVRLYKHGVRATTLMFPAGGKNQGESPCAAAQRELREETGYEATDWVLLGRLAVHSNYGCGHAYYFHARNAVRTQEPAHDDLEDIAVELHPRSRLPELVKQGDIVLMDCVAMLHLTSQFTPPPAE